LSLFVGTRGFVAVKSSYSRGCPFRYVPSLNPPLPVYASASRCQSRRRLLYAGCVYTGVVNDGRADRTVENASASVLMSPTFSPRTPSCRPIPWRVARSWLERSTDQSLPHGRRPVPTAPGPPSTRAHPDAFSTAAAPWSRVDLASGAH